MASCGGCDKTWTGFSMAHCSSPDCHQTFSSVANFDKHRIPNNPGSGRTPWTGPLKHCADVKALGLLGLVQNDNGTWRGEGEKDISWIHRLRKLPK